MFLSAILSLFVAQFAKAAIGMFKARPWRLKDVFGTLLWRTGGMPSSHSALAISLATAAGFSEGMGSNLFALSLFFALVVIRDALGVRRAAGLQAKALNSLGTRASRRLGLVFRPVKEIHGHTPGQVLVGGLLGFFIALAVSTL